MTFEIKIDQEEQKAKKEQEASEAELRSLGELEARAQASLARYKADTSAPAPVMDEALKAKLAANRLEVLAEYRIVKLSDAEYARRSRELRFDFDATYGNVPGTAPSVSFIRPRRSR